MDDEKDDVIKLQQLAQWFIVDSYTGRLCSQW